MLSNLLILSSSACFSCSVLQAPLPLLSSFPGRGDMTLFLGCHWTRLFGSADLHSRLRHTCIRTEEQRNRLDSPSSSLSFQPSVPGRPTKQRLRFHPQGQSCRISRESSHPQRCLLVLIFLLLLFLLLLLVLAMDHLLRPLLGYTEGSPRTGIVGVVLKILMNDTIGSVG